jgi:hypothetical protein
MAVGHGAQRLQQVLRPWLARLDGVDDSEYAVLKPQILIGNTAPKYGRDKIDLFGRRVFVATDTVTTASPYEITLNAMPSMIWFVGRWQSLQNIFR